MLNYKDNLKFNQLDSEDTDYVCGGANVCESIDSKYSRVSPSQRCNCGQFSHGNKCGHIDNCPVQGLCIKLCEQGAIIEEDGDVKIVPENCDDCDLCIQNCPNQAISKA